MSNPPIDIILPYKENMTIGNEGAIASIVHDLITYSGNAADFRVFGRPSSAKIDEQITYHGLKVRLGVLHGGQNLAFASTYLTQIKKIGLPRAIEIHSRCQIARKIATNQPNIPTFLYLHNDPTQMKGAKTITERQWLADNLAGIFCVSEFVRQKFITGLSIADSQKIVTIRNGVNRWLDVPAKKDKSILIAGRMVPEKGIYPACKAVKTVLSTHPDWHLHIIGGKRLAKSTISDYERALARLCEDMPSQITLHGFMDKASLRRYQQSASIIIVPSLWDEPAGLTNIEALAAGAALITTGTGGSAEYIDDNAVIVTVDRHDEFEHYHYPIFTAALAQACDNLIKDTSKRLKLQKAAWDNYVHDAHTMAENAVNIREKLINSFTSARL